MVLNFFLDVDFGSFLGGLVGTSSIVSLAISREIFEKNSRRLLAIDLLCPGYQLVREDRVLIGLYLTINRDQRSYKTKTRMQRMG
jgi:hypothetical protein